ncbi:MOSC domain-containing protein [Sporosarcina aquimarina]|uniref:MOSC domain-containing protein n=1 Tax=Sporosarcina aquimarina TaxID=114975 RepID=A0ABU4G0T6_9BACL|nr:MOSC domain-containing protein [Sporosarcina aquimarina]MDW0110578.1 MOSC domain-containing protein [Sporosarcina aquimarina]
MGSRQLVTLATGLPRRIDSASENGLISGICKQTITEAYLSVDGFQQDDVADKKHHGGPDRAVCLYPAEHYPLWNEEFGCTLPPAAFGENLTVSGLTESEVCIGDIYKVGDALIQLTQGRIPCNTIDQRLGHPVMKHMIETGFTGYLCRVLQEGNVRADSEISLHERNSHGVTVLEANTTYFHNPKDVEGLRRVLAIESLAEDWKNKFGKRLDTALATS